VTMMTTDGERERERERERSDDVEVVSDEHE
jgi:hypothetical protein